MSHEWHGNVAWLKRSISLKMIYDPPLPEGFSSLKDYVNSFLPEQIRMWGFVRTMKSFQARTCGFLLPDPL